MNFLRVDFDLGGSSQAAELLGATLTAVFSFPATGPQGSAGAGTTNWNDLTNKPSTFAPSAHTHGNITSDGKVGSASGLPLITTTGGVVTTLALGTANHVLRVNSGGTGLEFGDVSGAAIVPQYEINTANFAAVAGKQYLANTSSAPIQATLPADPAVGAVIEFADAKGTWGTNALVVAPNGNKIEGSTSNFSVNITGAFFSLIYIDSTTGWMVLVSAGIKPLNIGAPVVSGSSGFAATTGGWTGNPSSYSYQWQMSSNGSTGWANISGATTNSYTSNANDAGKYVRVGVTATNTNGQSSVAYSSASAIASTGSPFSSNLLAFYKLSNTSDASGNGYTLTNNNGVTFGAGKIGNAAIFNQSENQALSVSLTLTQTAAHSFSVWVKPTQLSEDRYWTVLSATGAGEGVLNVHSDASGNLYWNNASVGYISLGEVFFVDQWTHLVLTHDGAGTRKVFRNGALVKTQDNPPSFPPIAELRIGSLPDQGFDPHAIIDMVAVWNRALSTVEVTALYNSGNGLEPA